MYRKNIKQLEFENFNLPFGGQLRSDNRWVKLAKLIPWEEIEQFYMKSLSETGMGASALPARRALGALIIKERLGFSDRETVAQIQENPYLQYFIGLKAYQDEPAFDASMLVHFRKRFGNGELNKINELVSSKAIKEQEKRSKSKKSDKDDDGEAGGSGKEQRKGKLLMDATCTPADITYPTDLKLLNDAREKSEEIIDILHQPLKGKYKKPRTYRQRARKNFLKTVKSRRTGRKQLRKAIRKQLNYLKRNLKNIAKLNERSPLSLLNKRQYKNLLVIHEICRQQKWMYDNKSIRISDRIVSLSQPHIRPVKRGKAGSETEFGAKLSVSLVEGFAFVDRISWDNYNESGDLKNQVETYRDRFGVYPESVHADKIYRTRENRSYCKKHGIRLSGPPLGRPRTVTEENREELKKEAMQSYQDEVDRIPIEGKFGEGKRRYSLSRIMSKLPKTSEVTIILNFLVMNLLKWLKAINFYLVYCLLSRLSDFTRRVLQADRVADSVEIRVVAS